MEAHGTGTGLGDPIEVSAVSAVVSNSKEKCLISALKGNVGHTESTAGVAGVLKLARSLRGCEGTRNVQLYALNPQVRQARVSVLSVPTDSQVAQLERGGVSSFGWSGIIAHGVPGQSASLSDHPQTS